MDISEAISCVYNKQDSIFHNGFSGMNNEAISDLLAWRNNNENFDVEVNLFNDVGLQTDSLASSYSQPPEESQSGQFWQTTLERLGYNFNGSSNLIAIPSHDDNIILDPLLNDDHASFNVIKHAKRHARNNAIQYPMRNSNLQEQTMLRFHDHRNRQGKTNSDKKVSRKKCDKLANKITALQKMVSPYGKTDTASVLHEASVFIKVLHKEIQILTGEEKSQKKQVDLQTRRLCLVPASTMHNFIREESAALDRFMPP